MTDKHLITLPPELMEQWLEKARQEIGTTTAYNLMGTLHYCANQAARWGADQELEACCEWFQEFYKTESWVTHDLKHFRAARRPKPPSLKEQALEALEVEDDAMPLRSLERSERFDTIRRAGSQRRRC